MVSQGASDGFWQAATQRPGRVYDTMAEIFKLRTAHRCAAYLLPHIKPTDHILDVGCGPGTITLDLARLVPQGRVIGVDISAEFLGQAKEMAASQNVTNVEFIQRDALDLTSCHPMFAQDASFDIVHAHMVLMHVSDPVLCLRDMRRLLKPGGLAACRDSIQHIIQPETQPLASFYNLYRVSSKAKGGHADGGKYSHIWANEAGFPWDHIQTSAGGWEYSGLPNRHIWAEGIKYGTFPTVKAGLATQEEVEEHKVAWEEWAKRDDARMFSIDGQILCRK